MDHWGNPGCENWDTSLDGEVDLCHGALMGLTALPWTTWGRRGTDICSHCLVAWRACCFQMFHSAVFPTEWEEAGAQGHAQAGAEARLSAVPEMAPALACVCIGDSNPPRPTRYASHSSVTLSESNVTYLFTKSICWTKLMKTNTPNYEKEKEGHTGNQGLRKNCLEQFSCFLQSTARQLRFSWWTVLSPASIWSVSVSH